jgi:hypothetical protein
MPVSASSFDFNTLTPQQPKVYSPGNRDRAFSPYPPVFNTFTCVNL